MIALHRVQLGQMPEDAVVSDRAYNTRALANATSGWDAVERVDFDPRGAPDRETVTFATLAPDMSQLPPRRIELYLQNMCELSAVPMPTSAARAFDSASPRSTAGRVMTGPGYAAWPPQACSLSAQSAHTLRSPCCIASYQAAEPVLELLRMPTAGGPDGAEHTFHAAS